GARHPGSPVPTRPAGDGRGRWVTAGAVVGDAARPGRRSAGARHAPTTFSPPCTPGVTAVAKGRGLPLEPSSDELRDLGGAALDFVVDFVGRRPTAPAVNLDGAHDLVDTLLTPPPEEGRPFADLLSLISDAADVAVDTAGPGYMAYIPGGGLPGAAIAELVTLAFNRYPTVAALAPGLTAV